MNIENMTKMNNVFNSIISEDVSPVDEKIYEIVIILKNERKKQKISQETLAQLSGLTKNTISRIETLVSIPTLPAILKIANALKMDFCLKGIE